MPAGPNRKLPAPRSRIDAKTLGLSGRGRHIHSTRPLGATRQFASQSERNAYSAMGGNELAILIGAGTAPAWGAACPSPSVSGLMACPRSFSSALRATALRPQGAKHRWRYRPWDHWGRSMRGNQGSLSSVRSTGVGKDADPRAGAARIRAPALLPWWPRHARFP